MKVEIFAPVYNGMYILPMFIDHYMERFPGCTITMFIDKDTDDNSFSYCRERGCNVVSTNLREPKPISMTHLRNNYWKSSNAEWIIFVDQDELVDISLNDLEDIKDYDVIKFRGYNMVTTDGETDPRKFTHGRLHPWYCKSLMFKKTIGEINYTGGAHTVKPNKEYKENRHRYNMYHYPKRFTSKEAFIKEYERSVSREIASKLYDDETKNLKKIR